MFQESSDTKQTPNGTSPEVPEGEVRLVTDAVMGRSRGFSHPHVRCERLGCAVLLGSTGATLKDILAERHGLRNDEEILFLLPPRLFIDNRSYAELEFPAYFNAYIEGNLENGKPLRLAATREQAAAMREYLGQTLIGPDWDDPDVYSFVVGEERSFFRAMMHHYATSPSGNLRKLEDLVQICEFDTSGRVEVPADPGGRIIIQEIGHGGADGGGLDDGVTGYIVTEEVEGAESVTHLLEVEYNHPERELLLMPEESVRDMEQKRFGFSVTCLGNSTGFDPLGDTTSFVVWLGGTGILVDPSEEALRQLEAAGVHEQDVPYAILSHCHQDHDGGLLRRILQGREIKLIASRVVYGEFMRKAQMLLNFQGFNTGIDPRDLVEWIEMKPGYETRLHLFHGEEAVIESWWNVHPIPTNGFKILFRSASYGHSSDTQWSPEFLTTLRTAGILSEVEAERQMYRFMDREGNLKVSVLHHEAGGPPIHTDQGDLERAFGPDVEGRVFVYHKPDATVKSGSRFRKIGTFSTQEISPVQAGDSTRYHTAMMLAHPYFLNGGSELGSAVVSAAKEIEFPPDTLLYRQNTLSPRDGGMCSNQVVFITSGEVDVYVDGLKGPSRGPGMFLGDWGAVTDDVPSATVRVSHDAALKGFALPRQEFGRLLRQCISEEEVSNVKRCMDTLQRFAMRYGNREFQDLPLAALAGLARHCREREFKPHELMMKSGEEADCAWIIEEGSVTVEGVEGETPSSGDIVGEIALLENIPRTTTVWSSETGCTCIQIPKHAFDTLLKWYPALKNGLTLTAARRLRELRGQTAFPADEKPQSERSGEKESICRPT